MSNGRKKRKILPVTRNLYTGLLGPQTQGQTQRGAYRPPTGMTSITQGGLGQVEEDSVFEQYTDAATGIKDAYEMGQEVKKLPDYAEKAGDYVGDTVTDVGNWFSDSPKSVTQLQGSTNYSPAVSGARQPITAGYQPPVTNPNINPNFYSQTAPQASGMLSQGASPSTAGSGGTLNLPPTHYDIFKQYPTNFGQGITGAYSGGYNALGQGQGVFAPSAEMVEASGGLLEGMGASGKYAGDAYTGMQAGAEVGSAAAEASALSKIGSVAGIGLNAYDMANQGITANNMMGLLGSGIMAGTTMLGLANSWNPVGWALLGASALGSLTDWW